jgi:hypothetical protein
MEVYILLNSDFYIFLEPLNLNLAVEVKLKSKILILKIKCRLSIISKKLNAYLIQRFLTLTALLKFVFNG